MNRKPGLLKGGKVILRAMEPDDVDLLYELENDGHLWYLSNTVAPFSRFVLEQYILNSHLDIFSTKQLRLMIDTVDKEKNNGSVGMIDLFDFDPVNRRAGIGILLKKTDRGKGYASEALSLLIDYGFNVLHLHQLYCNITEENETSLNLFKNHGFEITGLKKEWILKNEGWSNEYLLQLLNKA